MSKEITGTLSRKSSTVNAEIPGTLKVVAGVPGPAGKSAYQYAVEGGFTGTEEEFKEKLFAATNAGIQFEIGENLILKDGILSVNTTDQMEQDNTLPITSAGVFATVGNIEALLNTI